MHRRVFLQRTMGVGAFLLLPSRTVAQLEQDREAAPFVIRPRSAWADGLGPLGPIHAEEPLFLLVHHTGQPGNNYTHGEVPSLLRNVYAYHTGSEKRWPDIAYNFLVDRYGTIWEGRQGSITGAVRGSATGGNQGYSQLCCFIGNLDENGPTDLAANAMADLLAWLAIRFGIDIAEGATATFTSLGSSKWATGTEVTADTISGHRDMSQTSCPGERGYRFVKNVLPGLVRERMGDTRFERPTDQPLSDADYWLLRSDGRLYPFGSDAETALVSRWGVAAAAMTSSGRAVWILNRDGTVSVAGDAELPAVPHVVLHPGEFWTSVVSTASGIGAWRVSSHGRVQALGSAVHHRDLIDLGALTLQAPIVDAALAHDGGLLLAASDGGVFALGSAKFSGSAGGIRLNQPIVAIAVDPTGSGYWLIASDGGVFAYGAEFHGSLGALTLNAPIVGAQAVVGGYRLVASDGGVFAMGAARFSGSLGDDGSGGRVVAMLSPQV